MLNRYFSPADTARIGAGGACDAGCRGRGGEGAPARPDHVRHPPQGAQGWPLYILTVALESLFDRLTSRASAGVVPANVLVWLLRAECSS